MKFQEALNELSINKNINLFAFATSPWHAHGVNACINLLKDKNVNLTGFIFIKRHAENGYVICKDNFFVDDNIRVELLDEENLTTKDSLVKMMDSLKYTFGLKNSSKSGRILYFIESWTVDAAKSAKIIKTDPAILINHIVYDEGVATYFPLHYKSSSLGEYIRNLFLKKITFGIGYKYISKHRSFLCSKLFLENKGKLTTNEIIIPYYKNAIKDYSLKNVNFIGFLPNTVLICTTAWNRDQITEDEDVNTIKSIADILITEGYNVIFKPHPRDNNFEILYSDYPVMNNANQSIESLLFNSDVMPVAVISISSTILVTIQLLFGLKCFDISKLLNVSKIGNYVHEITDFQNTFGGMIQEPASINELIIDIHD